LVQKTWKVRIVIGFHRRRSTCIYDVADLGTALFFFEILA